MPWKECHVVDERLRFVARLLDGEKMAALCEEFGISRKTGYKIFERYKDCGVQGLTDRQPAALSARQSAADGRSRSWIVRLKRDYPSWGAPKIRERLRRRCPDAAVPGDQHGACGAGSAWPGDAPARGVARGAGHAALAADARPTTSGAPTTKASSCSPTAATAIR